jgi:hypothetical protein
MGDDRVGVNSRFLSIGGTPRIPVSGELHYSRVPRPRWAERLRLMRSGGLTAVASYVPWLHHEERRGEARFDGNLDVAAFADLCAESGLDLVLRIGPWIHAEARNGGFPDWVQAAPVRHRTDDPAYLALVAEWFGRLAAQVGGRRLFAVQLENELYDQPAHLLTLKRLAIEAGLRAPLWTATAWGGARLPEQQIMPLYGGYGDGFWTDADAPWDPTFRAHFLFSHVWDDPGIGADLRAAPATGGSTTSALFPPATCELGGGMPSAYHRRPWQSGLDIAAVAHCKIGNGSVWQGYYMFAGGTNPPGEHGMQESHATGYPNDMPRLGYEFHGPIGESGLLNEAHALLRAQHAFLDAFGPALAAAPSTLPSVLPSGVEDTETLRWAVRGPFVFIAWHQPHIPLPDYRAAQFTVDDMVFPSRPVDIPVGTLARWPAGLDVAGVRVDWATASALTVLPGPVPTLVLCAEPGVPAEISIDGVVRQVEPSREPIRLGIDVLVLPAPDARICWVAPGGRLLLSTEDLGWDAEGRISLRSASSPSVLVYDPVARSFGELPLRGGPAGSTVDVVVSVVRDAGEVPEVYGTFGGRQSAPPPDVFDELAAVYRLDVPERADLLRIDWAGDVAELRVDGRTVADRFWNGAPWAVDLRDLPRGGITLHVLPIAAGNPVHLPAAATARRAAAPGRLGTVDAVRAEVRNHWAEVCGRATVPGDEDLRCTQIGGPFHRR